MDNDHFAPIKRSSPRDRVGSGEDGTRGEAAWPIELPGDEVATEGLRATSAAQELALWSELSGVEPSAFDYRLPD